IARVPSGYARDDGGDRGNSAVRHRRSRRPCHESGPDGRSAAWGSAGMAEEESAARPAREGDFGRANLAEDREDLLLVTTYGAGPRGGPPRDRYIFTVTVFTSVYCCKPYSPSSRPIPDCLKPPKGARGSRTL